MADGCAPRAMCRCCDCSRGNGCDRAVPSRYDAATDPLWQAPSGDEYARRQDAIAEMMETE